MFAADRSIRLSRSITNALSVMPKEEREATERVYARTVQIARLVAEGWVRPQPQAAAWLETLARSVSGYAPEVLLEEV